MELKTIKEKANILIQKGSYLTTCKVIPNRLWKFGKPREGQFSVDLSSIIGHPYGSSFKLVMFSKRKFTVEKIEKSADSTDSPDPAENIESGIDNRNVTEDRQTQNLGKAEIHQLLDSGASGVEVIQALTQNHRSFKSKTKYSQEKYVSKKQKKYEDIITIYEPTIRQLVKMSYMQDPVKISNLRIDSLSQVLSYANVQSGGSYAVYEAGTNGLVTAAMLKRIGGSGHLVHVYKEACLHRGALDLMNFKEEEIQSLSYICADNLPDFTEEEQCTDAANGFSYLEKMDEDAEESPRTRHGSFARSRVEDVNVSTRVLGKGVDGIIVACKQHPSAITIALLSYLKPGNSFAVFSPYKETLMDLYSDLKLEKCLNVRLCESWLRHYQVLPERTHPEINMSGSGGYILYGWKVEK